MSTHPPDLIDRIRDLWADPANTGAKIGDLTGFSRAAIDSIVFRRRLVEGLARWPLREAQYHAPEMATTIKPLWAKGLSMTEIAHKLGMNRNQIIGIVFRARKAEGVEEWPLHERRPSSVPKPGPAGIAQQNRLSARMAGEARRLAKGLVATHKPPSPKQPLARPVAQPLPTEGLVRFLDYHRGQCAWPCWPDNQAWKPSEVDHVMVCGRPVADVTDSYCECHRRLAYTPAAKTGRAFRHLAMELA